MQRSDHNARTATRLRVEASAMDASCSEGPVTSRNKLALTVMDLPQTENVHNTALGAHWARVTPSNLILTTSNRRHACATLTVARPWAHGPVLRAAALAEAISVTRGRAPSGPVRRLCVHGSMVIRALVRAWCSHVASLTRRPSRLLTAPETPPPPSTGPATPSTSASHPLPRLNPKKKKVLRARVRER